MTQLAAVLEKAKAIGVSGGERSIWTILEMIGPAQILD
jgi:hypothetical protein